ncbi:SDR family NAD(P)-dependent oxidoreductase [Jeotgalibacillus soli]|uniref:Short-chain dehydrogenase n=1 Tax=Jeotgalibacillus soli TaxID=889306 RepID=A0A0C2W806_9BACL|nr:SDR family NAD(P)-dependent oxidoreductase [Jeotgalibacillus soli]KIL52158.1 hypothetical protein KP78_05280 [Jeotgalibacillus soli]
MKQAIVTGASKGLGAGIAYHLLMEGINIVDLSRSGNTEIKALAEKKSLTYKHEAIDISSTQQTLQFFESWFNNLKDDRPEELYLIHNAGTVDPIDTVGHLDPNSVERSVHLNYITPMVVTNLAFKRSSELDISLIVVNITSGAADKPNHGWSVYGSTKAGLNLFTETAALEQKEKQTRHTIISFSPSIMDTEMQQVIRSSSESAFSQVSRFQKYKDKGELRQPNDVGKALVTLLMNEPLENGKLYHINDLLP